MGTMVIFLGLFALIGSTLGSIFLRKHKVAGSVVGLVLCVYLGLDYAVYQADLTYTRGPEKACRWNLNQYLEPCKKFRTENGRFPQDLKELKPKYLEELLEPYPHSLSGGMDREEKPGNYEIRGKSIHCPDGHALDIKTGKIPDLDLSYEQWCKELGKN